MAPTPNAKNLKFLIHCNYFVNIHIFMHQKVCRNVLTFVPHQILRVEDFVLNLLTNVKYLLYSFLLTAYNEQINS